MRAGLCVSLPSPVLGQLGATARWWRAKESAHGSSDRLYGSPDNRCPQGRTASKEFVKTGQFAFPGSPSRFGLAEQVSGGAGAANHVGTIRIESRVTEPWQDVSIPLTHPDAL